MTCIDIVGWDAVGVPGPTGAHSKRHKILEKKGTESASNHALEVANIAMRRRTAPEGFMPPKTASFLLEYLLFLATSTAR